VRRSLEGRAFSAIKGGELLIEDTRPSIPTPAPRRLHCGHFVGMSRGRELCIKLSVFTFSWSYLCPIAISVQATKQQPR
jgi:hypothetical protein